MVGQQGIYSTYTQENKRYEAGIERFVAMMVSGDRSVPFTGGYSDVQM
jgi:hypothetical protein